MEKRIFVAIAISIAFLWVWAAVAPRFFPQLAPKQKPRPAASGRQALPPVAPSPTPAPVEEGQTGRPSSTPISESQVRYTVIENSSYSATFSNRGAQLVSFKLKNYKSKDGHPVELVKARDPKRTDFPFAIEAQDAKLAAQLNNALYAVQSRDERGVHIVEYRYAEGSVSATKTFRISQEYLIDFSIQVLPPAQYRVVVGPGIRTLSPKERDTEGMFTGQGVVQREGDLEIIDREKGDRVNIFTEAEYVGIEDNYFLTVLRPSKGGARVLRRIDIRTGPKDVRKELYAGVTALPDGSIAGNAFFGPKETKLLDRYGLGEALQFGWFGVIARFLLEALVFVNRYTLNYGFAIIVLTIVIKIVLYPLQHKSIVSMKKMQKVQPKMEVIKNKYKKARTDPEQRQKMNVEMMQLYQKEGINPMSGCIPILLQLPILWGFYGLLSRAIELRGAPWILWIKDLSEKDPTYILPILMTATMFIQTYITPTTGDPAQRRIFLMMPLIFGFVFKDFPSGLVLYWLVQNVLTIAQQMIMNKWWKDHPDELQKA